MAFALIYEQPDLEEIERRFQEADVSNAMTNAQRRRLRDYWNAGLSTWRTATPQDLPQYNCRTGPYQIGVDEDTGAPIMGTRTCRVIVINLGNGSRADFLGNCTEVVNRLPIASVGWFAGIVDDMKNTGTVEPWPPV